jgi:uncharacterized protein YndB with AHSA1/START domain
MKNELMTDFTVDKAEKKVKIKREFAAPKKHVWAAWTEKELLDQWWAPKPWKSETKSMDFREGGRRLYAMVSPEGEKHWSFADYKSITSQRNLKFRDGFCDIEGNVNREMPQSDWNVNFVEYEDLTTVNIEIQHEELSDLETIIEMGFKEGITATLEQLSKILSAKSNQ